MVRIAPLGSESVDNNNNNKNKKRKRDESKKYIRYTDEQIEILERVFAECPNPDKSQRQQIIRDHPLLDSVENTHLKTWFQNRRCREKQRKENVELTAENKKLRGLLKQMKEESNSHQQRQVVQLIAENEYLRNYILTVCVIITKFREIYKQIPLPLPTATHDVVGHAPPEVPISQFYVSVANDINNIEFDFLAEETRSEFLSKAIGTSINWIPVPLPELSCPISFETIYVSSCNGVAARACTTVPFEPIKTIEILKDRLSWCRECRSMKVIANRCTDNGGTIEIIYTQHFASTSMACARDFLTLRYTSLMDDGSFVICEKSISGSDTFPSSTSSLEFMRGKILASGYLVCPCEGGSKIHFVEHFNLESSSVSELVRPLYESPALLAEKMIIPAIHYFEHVACETNGKQTPASAEDSAFVRSFALRLTRGFNHAVNGFTEDGWSLLSADVPDNVIVSVNQTANFLNANYDNVICVKASLFLQNVLPSALVKVLKDHRAAWMGFDFANHYAAFSRAACFAFPGVNYHNLSETTVRLGNTNQDEMVEVVRFDRTDSYQFHIPSGDLYHLQLINGMGNTAFGACSELIFAAIERTTPNDAPLLSSGFRVFLMNSNTEPLSSVNLTQNQPSSLLTLAFQFPFEAHLEEDAVIMAKQYIQHVISSVKFICTAAMPVISPLEVSLGSVCAINSTESNPIPEFDINHGSLAVPSESVRAINSNEINPVMGQTINPMAPEVSSGSICPMNSSETDPFTGVNINPMAPEVALGSVCAMDSPESNPIPEFNINYGTLAVPSGSVRAMNYTEINPVMGQTINPIVPEVSSGSIRPMNSSETDPFTGININPIAPEVPLVSFCAIDSTESNPIPEFNINYGTLAVPSGSIGAINSNEINPMMGQTINPIAPEVSSGSIRPMNSSETDPFTGININPIAPEVQLVSFCAMNTVETNHVIGLNTNLSAHEVPSGSVRAINSTETDPVAGLNTNLTAPEVPCGSVLSTNSTETNHVMGINITPDSVNTINLANLICQSYRSSLGMEMLGFNRPGNTSLSELMLHHQYAIMCFSPTSVPVCMYANRAALNMLETTTDNIQSLTIDKILNGSNNVPLASVLPTIVQQGYAILPPGYCLSIRNHLVFYEQVVVWPVQAPDGSLVCLALAFINRSFTGIS